MAANRAENLVDGHRTLPVLLADLAAARTTIHISIFLFFNDPIGKEIERVLCERARAGVKIRILVNLEKTEMGDPFSTGEEEMMEKAHAAMARDRRRDWHWEAPDIVAELNSGVPIKPSALQPECSGQEGAIAA